MNEFNQCQTQLKELYESALGKVRKQLEFLAYRILYCVFTQDHQKKSATSRIEMNTVLASLTEEQRQDDAIHHALQVREAVAFNDYVRFFELRRTAPNLGMFIMNAMVDRVRLQALRAMCAGYVSLHCHD